MLATRASSPARRFQRTGFEFSGNGDAAQISAARLTPGVFQVLGVSPSIGRVFTQQEDDARQQVAVISYQMWNSRFHADQHILGTKVLLDRRSYEIIGVMPRDFEFPLSPASWTAASCGCP